MKKRKTQLGIDVSHHNGTIDWSKVTVDYAILRAGYGKKNIRQIDKQFERNYNECKRLGIPVGVYHYSYAKTVEDARQEAEFLLELIEGKQFEYPVYYDIEEQDTFDKGVDTVSEIAKTFCDILEEHGYFVGIYTSSSAAKKYFSKEVRDRYSMWIAHWYVTQPNYTGNYAMWQYSARGNVNGINGDVDLNLAFSNFPNIMKKNHLNGF